MSQVAKPQKGLTSSQEAVEAVVMLQPGRWKSVRSGDVCLNDWNVLGTAL